MSFSRDTQIIIAAGAMVLALSFGVRSTFGIALDPISDEFGWPREIFSLSIAIQNIVWGLTQPLFGAVADRLGDRKALWLGLATYVAGMAITIVGTTPAAMHLGAGVLVGMGTAGTAFGLVLAVVGRSAPEETRSAALGTVAALGALGQMALPLMAGWVIAAYGWQAMMAVMLVLLLPIALCIPKLDPKLPPGSLTPEPMLSLPAITARAFGHGSYVLLTLGFFVCGFHIAFITAHFPAYVEETCNSVTLGATALGVVGGANVVGTYLAGRLGQVFPKNLILSAIYALRAVVILVFISMPPSPVTVIVFSMAMGVLWLSTVPLTSALVATMFGPRYMATLYGFVFLSHQIGSFLGVWLGGRVYDLYGSYDLIWYAGIALGIFSAIVHLPVRERAWEARAVPA